MPANGRRDLIRRLKCNRSVQQASYYVTEPNVYGVERRGGQLAERSLSLGRKLTWRCWVLLEKPVYR